MKSPENIIINKQLFDNLGMFVVKYKQLLDNLSSTYKREELEKTIKSFEDIKNKIKYDI